jgi:hypothetical protein
MHYENVSEKKPISTDNNQCVIRQKTLNTKATNNKENIHEFNFKSAKNKELQKLQNVI